MSTPAASPVGIDPDPKVTGVEVSDTAARIMLSDGRELSAPLAWFPRLANGALSQRAHWELAGAGYRVHWPDADEDISVRAVMGQPTKFATVGEGGGTMLIIAWKAESWKLDLWYERFS